jgi:hypothetical protein
MKQKQKWYQIDNLNDIGYLLLFNYLKIRIK